MSLTILAYMIIGILVLLAGVSIYKIYKENKGVFTQEAWIKVSEIGRETIDECLEFYNSRKDRNILIDEIIEDIKCKISDSKLSKDEKMFFSNEIIEIFFRKRLNEIIDELDKRLKK